MTHSGSPWPVFGPAERAAVNSVLESGQVNYWTGSEGRKFESEFAEFTGLEHAVVVANGTVALELALRALGLPPGSEVVTSPFTFIATASAIVAAGLTPIFADVDPQSGNITAASIRETITHRTAAVLVVHLGGWPADMHSIRTLCSERGLALLEDCAQAHGAMIGDKHVGTFSNAAAWSFCTDKIISTGGEGGMVATNDHDLWQRMWSYKDHGKSWSAVYERDHPPGFRWLHESFGTNWRATEMQSAIGRVQYRQLPSWHEQRTTNAHALARLLDGAPGLRIPVPPTGFTHAYYRLYAYVDSSLFMPGWDRDRVIGTVNARSTIPISTGSSAEIYREVAFTSAGIAPVAPLPVAQRMCRESLALLVHPGIVEPDLVTLSDLLLEVLTAAMD